ncbi:TetR/AcrR family transcriptional regulator [Kineococcus terrestris]|uniref:TetR/AcrR family transcriptional regulator n=1 Tax=Kineococcus terrestris TaxID=2044856 RepID=UPI0034DAF7A7
MPADPTRPRVRMSAEQRRRQVLEAATALIAEHGYRGLAVQDVADACGLTLGGLLHHFGSKSGLLTAVLEHRDEQDHRSLAEHLGAAAHPDPPAAGAGDDLPEPTLAELCAAIVRRNAGQREIVRLYAVLEVESLAPEHPAHRFFAERQRRTLDHLTRLAPPGPDARDLARHVLALMDGLQVQWLRDPEVDLVSAWRRTAQQVPHLAPAGG